MNIGHYFSLEKNGTTDIFNGCSSGLVVVTKWTSSGLSMSTLSSWIPLVIIISSTSIIIISSILAIVISNQNQCLTFLTPALLIFLCFLGGSFNTSVFSQTLKTPICVEMDFFSKIVFLLNSNGKDRKHQKSIFSQGGWSFTGCRTLKSPNCPNGGREGSRTMAINQKSRDNIDEQTSMMDRH